MSCELFASKYRTFAGIIIQVFWGVATCLLALLAYLIRNWVYLQLFISLSGLFTIPLFWYVVSQRNRFNYPDDSEGELRSCCLYVCVCVCALEYNN